MDNSLARKLSDKHLWPQVALHFMVLFTVDVNFSPNWVSPTASQSQSITSALFLFIRLWHKTSHCCKTIGITPIIKVTCHIKPLNYDDITKNIHLTSQKRLQPRKPDIYTARAYRRYSEIEYNVIDQTRYGSNTCNIQYHPVSSRFNEMKTI